MNGNEKKEPPMGALVLLSMLLPGAGQLANKQTVKGVATIAVSALLFVDIIVHAFIILLPIAGMTLAGERFVIDENTIEPLKTLAIVAAIALAIWAWALWDTVRVAKKRAAGTENS